jgi:hypothetical protein
MAQATFGAGCFWGVEVAFRQVPGVIDAAVGYAGGTLADPSYEQVCTGRTGHAEVVQVEYDPQRVGYEQLLDVFFASHDPTQLNRQGRTSGPSTARRSSTTTRPRSGARGRPRRPFRRRVAFATRSSLRSSRSRRSTRPRTTISATSRSAVWRAARCLVPMRRPDPAAASRRRSRNCRRRNWTRTAGKPARP